jgi:Tfp pilus tip-associated adhesin PilY1
MSYYGIREGTVLTSGVAKTDLVNTTGIRVSAVTDKVADSTNASPFNIAGTSVSTFPQLLAAIEAKSGWYINFDSLAARNIDRSLTYKNSLLFIEYKASNDSCSPAGSSRLFAPNLLTGTASPFVALEASETVKVGTTESASSLAVDLGAGQAFLSGMYKDYLFINKSSGDFLKRKINDPPPSIRSGRTSWRELPLPAAQ